MKQHGAKALKRLKAAWTRLVKSNLPRIRKVSSRDMAMRRACLEPAEPSLLQYPPPLTDPPASPPAPPTPPREVKGDASEAVETAKKISSQERELRCGETVTCGGGCGRKVTAYSGFRCRQCFVFFCGQCALDHFGLVVEPSTGRVLDARS